jgi:MYXO-CTERM domain-containing protein
MLQVLEDPVDENSSATVNPYLAHVINLDDGDVIQYSFKAYDPSEGRSPSVLAGGVYGNDIEDIDSFAGFFTPFQSFPPGTGWLDIIADAAPDDITFPVDPNLVFDEGDMVPPDRVAITLRSLLFRPTLSTVGANGSGTYKFFIDDLRISVTSDNPDASIMLPDGSVTLVNASVNGDFDNNGVWECFDVDSLVDEIVQVAGGATPNLDFDLTGDNDVTTEDLTAWLAEAGPERGFAGPILEGDANLDGSVDGPDFLTWNDNKFTSDNLWCGGDFNADGTTDGPDFLIWNENKFQSSDVSAVPEPALGLLSLLGLAFVVRRRR